MADSEPKCRLVRVAFVLVSSGTTQSRSSALEHSPFGSSHVCSVIDDVAGHTLAAASTVEKSLSGLKTGADTNAATEVGGLIAERAKPLALRALFSTAVHSNTMAA